MFSLFIHLASPLRVGGQDPRRAGASFRGSASDSVAEREVRVTEAARFNAMTHSDFAALDTLLAADLSYTHNDGTRESKSVFLASLRSGDIAYLGLQPDSVLVRVYGSTAIADGRISIRA